MYFPAPKHKLFYEQKFEEDFRNTWNPEATFLEACWAENLAAVLSKHIQKGDGEGGKERYQEIETFSQ